ncbi:MAG: hypothetical protein M1814_001392 [Vezdaea aestivalis]|nr:MAG: hypothetical protein M1814_001392 [Vezdaea aestivalis]
MAGANTDEESLRIEPYTSQLQTPQAATPEASTDAINGHPDNTLPSGNSTSYIPSPSRGPAWVPQWLRKTSGAIVGWANGPQPPRQFRIEPFFPRFQTAPLRLLDRICPGKRRKVIALVVFYFLWLFTFSAVLHHSAFAGDIPGFGEPTHVSCLASYWARGNQCGVDGNECRPFNNSVFAFRCPANCIKTHVNNPRAVGRNEVIYAPFVIGGPQDQTNVSSSIYRGDSFLCGAAIHAGIVSNSVGGCGVTKLVGEKTAFPASQRHSISSIGFDSSFPLAFTFLPEATSQCKDLRWPLLAVSVIFTCLASLFITSSGLFFSTVFVGIYIHVGLVSDPPNLADYYSIISIVLGRFLPSAFCAFVFHKYCIHRTLTGLTAQFEKTILWLGSCWVGALTNYTFDFIPIQRLTPHDLNQQPGAKAALVIIILALLLIAFGQIWALRKEGRLPRMLALYAFFFLMIGLLAAVPGLKLRIHHYILGLLLMPGTSIQTRPSLLWQGILVGFFINGTARWGFDSILQTAAVLQGDGQLGTRLPSMLAPVITSTNITLAWEVPRGVWDGVSVLVNDVERYRAFVGYDPEEFVWSRKENDKKKYYFRFGYMAGSDVGDYTKAGVWESDGSWTPMEKGASK